MNLAQSFATATAALGPIFALILLGQALRRADFPGSAFWPPAERLAYYLLLPALLLKELALADLGGYAFAPLIAVIVVSQLLMTALAYVLRPWLAADGAGFGSVYQGVIRLNTYVGLAAAPALFGRAGAPLAALALAIMVPLVNLLCVAVITHAQGRVAPWRLAAAVLRNPLIVACALGLALNLGDLGLPWGSAGLLDILSRAALPLGLLTMGAGLHLTAVGGRAAAVGVAVVLKLVGLPLLVWAGSVVADLAPLERAVLTLFAALPGAPSAYVLARQMGGDAPLAAAIVTVQTAAAMLTLPLLALLLAPALAR